MPHKGWNEKSKPQKLNIDFIILATIGLRSVNMINQAVKEHI